MLCLVHPNRCPGFPVKLFRWKNPNPAFLTESRIAGFWWDSFAGHPGIIDKGPMAPPSHSSSAEDLYHEGLDRLAEGDAAGAIQKLRDCLAIDPGMLDAMHGLIRALQEQREFDDAIAVAKRLLQLDPDEVLAHTSLSILYQHKGMIAEAEAESLQAKLLGWKKHLRQQNPKP
jgi:Tfp pilus assembly protein PilF